MRWWRIGFVEVRAYTARHAERIHNEWINDDVAPNNYVRIVRHA